MGTTIVRDVTSECVTCGGTFAYRYKGGPKRRTCSYACRLNRQAGTQAVYVIRKDTEGDEYPTALPRAQGLSQDALEDMRAARAEHVARRRPGRIDSGRSPDLADEQAAPGLVADELFGQDSTEESDHDPGFWRGVDDPGQVFGGQGYVMDDYAAEDTQPYRLFPRDEEARNSIRAAYQRARVEAVGMETGTTSSMKTVGMLRVLGDPVRRDPLDRIIELREMFPAGRPPLMVAGRVCTRQRVMPLQSFALSNL